MKQEARNPSTGLRKNDTRGTPHWIVLHIEDITGISFDLDPCTSHFLAKADRYITLEGEYEDGVLLRPGCGLTLPWRGNVFVNPPFSQLYRWASKCWQEHTRNPDRVIAMLVPNTKAEQRWWQTWVEPFRGGGVLQTLNREDRVSFTDEYGKLIEGTPWFGVTYLIWGARPIKRWITPPVSFFDLPEKPSKKKS